MNTEHDDLETSPEDLLCDQALQGLDDHERARLEALLAVPDESLERTAAAVAVVIEQTAGLTPLPEHVAARLLRDARPFVRPPIMAVAAETRRLRLAAWSGWIAAAAASIALAVVASGPREKGEPRDPFPAGLPHVALKTSGHPLAGKAGGELFWDPARQEGYMKLEGLAPVEPGKG